MLEKLLGYLDKSKGSDLYISVGLPPTIKLNGRLESLSEDDLMADDIYDLLESALDEDSFIEFKRKKEANFALHIPSIGRFRISAFMQKEADPGSIGNDAANSSMPDDQVVAAAADEARYTAPAAYETLLLVPLLVPLPPLGTVLADV